MPAVSTSPILALADKVVSLINAESWTVDGEALLFTARRLYRVEYKPEELTTLRVDVMVSEQEKEIEDRAGTTDRAFTIAIGVQKAVADKTSVSEVDALVNFTCELADFFLLLEQFTVTGSQLARCTGNAVSVIYSPADLDVDDTFFGLVTLEFNGWYS